MLYFSLLGNAGSRSAGSPEVGSGPRPPIPIGKERVHGRRRSSLEVNKDQKRKTIEFLTDDNAKAEGQLQVASQARLEYRSADDRKMAIHVAVTPASAFMVGDFERK